MPAEQLAELPAKDRLGRIGELGEERQHMSDHEQLLRRAGSIEHGIRVLRVERDRLFDEDVLTGLQSLDGGLRVQVGRIADVDHVDVRIGEQVVELAIQLDAGEIHTFAARPKLPWIDRQSPASLLSSRCRSPGPAPR